MKKTLSLLLFLSLVLSAMADGTTWYNPMEAGRDVINGRGWSEELANTYHRLPTRFYEGIPARTQGLSRMAAGLTIRFITNSRHIKFRYKVANNATNYANQAMLNSAGLDLYSTDVHGETHWVANMLSYRLTGRATDTISINYNDISTPLFGDRGAEYEVFLPPYNVVEWMSIGVDEGSKFCFTEGSAERPIVVYGTSIAHGASASRPGLIWTSRLSRKLDIPVVNLGFSGAAMMEPVMFQALSELDARAYIIDVVPNSFSHSDEEFIKRFEDGIRQIRSKSQAPIFIAQSNALKSVTYSQNRDNRMRAKDKLLPECIKRLEAAGIKGLYLVTNDQFGFTDDDTIEGIHPNDAGMAKYAEAYERAMRPVLFGEFKMQNYTPCRQRRDGCYEWMERHNEIIKANKANNPDILMIGNSITHFWGGQPECERAYGADSWNKMFKDHTVTNMGMGWDRVENVYWRFQHGELDDCSPKQIFLMIGTNNLNLQPNKIIATGVADIVKFIRAKQPQAMLYIVKVYPRIKNEENVADLNREIELAVEKDDHIEIIDATDCLTLKDGSGKIDPVCFMKDGLHPVKEGYARLAKTYKKYIKK